jgi:2-polyprenyl-3-methyl-5-hydroxy-6-metoxy-1,4-benzoquinol methylase
VNSSSSNSREFSVYLTRLLDAGVICIRIDFANFTTTQGWRLNKINRWIHFNLRYLGQPPWDTGVSPPELIKYLQRAAPGKALDVGCGTGTNLLTMASFGWTVVGIDLAWISVLKARAS